MTQVLTGTEVEEILKASWAEGKARRIINETERYFEMPSQLGQGCWREFLLRPGLRLSIVDVEKHQTHRHQIPQHPDQMPLALCYYLSGGCRVDNDSFRLPSEEVTGHSYLYCLPNTAEIEEYLPGQRLKKVRISIEPQMIRGLCDRIQELPNPLRQTIEEPGQALLYYSTPITLAQKQILQQIWKCPYQGLTQRIYLEAKVLELLALELEQILNRAEQPRSVAPGDLEQLYQARDILLNDIVRPPSLPELARRVNLNERKLKLGFRQVFDTTVFGCLTQQRMAKACELLAQQRVSVTGVAFAVGYSSAAAFSNAFRRQFGLSPKQYQITQRS
ncbi:MAG: AraC family transcriptional regulator [Cyanobacteria bacterium P01_F01_bin.3]